MAVREMYDGNGPGSKLARKLITGIADGPANTFAATERNITPERPFIDRSNPNQPKTQIFGAMKDRISNFFQPGDPGYNYESNDGAVAPVAPKRSIADVSPPPATAVTPVSAPARTALPNRIRNFTNSQNADGSGTLTRTQRPPRAGIATTPVTAAPAAITAQPATATPESAGYGEYTGDASSRIAAGPAVAAQSIPSIAAPAAPQTSTIGYGHGVYELAAGENAPPDYNNMSIGDLAVAKFGINQQVKRAGIANINSEITSRGNRDVMTAAELPSRINQNIASARHANVAADLGIFKAPAEVDNIRATTDHTKASTEEILGMMDPKKNAMLSDARYKDGMLKVAVSRLGILKDQIAQHAAQAAKGDAADWGGISKSALEGVKLLDAKAALGGLTPEDEQLRKNYMDTYNAAFVRQKRTAYQPQQLASSAGVE